MVEMYLKLIFDDYIPNILFCKLEGYLVIAKNTIYTKSWSMALVCQQLMVGMYLKLIVDDDIETL